MIYILKIGYQKFALKTNTGVSTILKVLGDAAVVKEDNRYKNEGLELDDNPAELNLEVLPHFNFVKRKKTQAVFVEPEVLPPDHQLSRPLYHGNGIFQRAIAKGQLRLPKGSAS